MDEQDAPGMAREIRKPCCAGGYTGLSRREWLQFGVLLTLAFALSLGLAALLNF